MNFFKKIIDGCARLKRKLYEFRLLFVSDSPIQSAGKETSSNETTKECTRDAATRKRVAKAFKEQDQAIKARSLKPHGANCKDPVFCEKQNCFTFKPDTIVKKTRMKHNPKLRRTIVTKE